MTKTTFTKIIIDILMYADFIFLMSQGTVRNLSIHAYGGNGTVYTVCCSSYFKRMVLQDGD